MVTVVHTVHNHQKWLCGSGSIGVCGGAKSVEEAAKMLKYGCLVAAVMMAATMTNMVTEKVNKAMAVTKVEEEEGEALIYQDIGVTLTEDPSSPSYNDDKDTVGTI